MSLSSLVYIGDKALETSGLELLKILNDKKTDTYGAILVDRTSKQLYIVFRGTQNARDILTDIECDQHKTKINGKECHVHAGFLKAYESVKSQIDSFPFKEYPYHGIITCGHSLGGALATICAADLAIEDTLHSINTITFGSPRVADKTFVDIFTNKVGVYYRFVHNNDIVPTLPHINYKHVGKQIRLDDDGNEISYFDFWKRIVYWIKGLRKLDLKMISIEDHFMDGYIHTVKIWCTKN